MVFFREKEAGLKSSGGGGLLLYSMLREEYGWLLFLRWFFFSSFSCIVSAILLSCFACFALTTVLLCICANSQIDAKHLMTTLQCVD